MSTEEQMAPSDMRAWTQAGRGPPSSILTLSKTVKTPTLTSPTSVLIRVSHASLNPGGSIMMQLVPFIFRTAPSIPELDFSGTIAAVGSNVPASRNLEIGKSVFGSVTISAHVNAGFGALAEYVVVPAKQVVLKPQKTSFEEAAGLPVAGSTAVLLVEKAGLKKGDSVLINGASGGIGSMVVQLVREAVGKSGRIVGICSGRNVEMVKALGADEVIDYQAHEPVTQYLTEHYSKPGFDTIIDAYGIQELYTHCPAYLRSGKPFISAGVAFKEYSYGGMLFASQSLIQNRFLPRILGGVNRDYVAPACVATLESMEKLRKLVEERKLKVVIDSTWAMEDVQQAYEKMLSRRAAGKIIVKVQDV